MSLLANRNRPYQIKFNVTEEEKKLSAKEKKIVESLSDSNGNLSKTSSIEK